MQSCLGVALPSVNKLVNGGGLGVGVISILCFVKLASRAFQKYNNKSSGSTGSQYFTCETVGQTST